jgi:hypothetical protein
MSPKPRVGVQIWPGGTPDYPAWRQAIIDVESLGADVIFGYDQGVSLFTTEVKPTEAGYDLTIVKEMVAWRDGCR